MEQEKRRFSRITFRMDAELVVDGHTYHFDRITNLSVGGCLFDLDVALTVGTNCQVRIILNDADHRFDVRATGTVLRALDQKVSVKFTSIDPDSLHHLHNIIRYNAADPEVIEDEIEDHPGLM